MRLRPEIAIGIIFAGLVLGRNVVAAEPEGPEQQTQELVTDARRLADKGKTAEAIVVAERARALLVERLGKDHEQTAAIDKLIESWQKNVQLPGAKQVELAQATQLTGQNLKLSAEGKVREAIPVAQRVLAIHKKILGEKHPDTASTSHNLGAMLLRTKDYAGAKQHFEQALAIRKEIPGEKHLHFVESLNDLGGRGSGSLLPRSARLLHAHPRN